MVHTLDILAGGRVALQVADGLDLASGHLHQDAAAPLGTRLEAHVVELILDDVLQLHVDGRRDVIALDGGDALGTHDAVGQLDVPGHTGLAVQQRVKRHLQARMAVDARTLLVLSHVADTAGRHVTVGLHAAAVLLVVEAVLVLGTAQERELAHTLILHVREHAGEEFIGAVLAALLAIGGGPVGSGQDFLAVAQNLLAPLGSTHRVVEAGKAVAQGADVLHQGIFLDAVGKPVDAHHIVLQVGCQHSTVVGQQFAALGLDGHGVHQHLVGLLVPLGSLHHRGLEKIPGDEGRESQHDAHHDGVAHQDMSFVIVFHCRET